MFLRYKRWQQLNDDEQVRKVIFHSMEFFFWKNDEGICDVRNKGAIENLLNPADGRTADFEIAYERYGIHFDGRGNEVDISISEEKIFKSKVKII